MVYLIEVGVVVLGVFLHHLVRRGLQHEGSTKL